MTRASEEHDDLVSRLLSTPLYDVDGWESGLPEEAAKAVIHLRHQLEGLRAEIVNLTSLRSTLFSEDTQ